jgi:hypothetical protein
MPTRFETTGIADLDERFLQLVLADHDLLEAEFDAMVDASWPDRPSIPRKRARGVSRRRLPPSPATPPSLVACKEGRPVRHVEGWFRDRSPPLDPAAVGSGRGVDCAGSLI